MRSDGEIESGESVTIYDVAAEAGVAASTVSRTFSRPGRVSYSTAERVRAAAERIGYRTEAVARASATGGSATKTLGLVVADIANPVFIEMVRGAEYAASQAGLTVVFSNSRENGKREYEALNRALPTVDGLLLAGSRLPDTTIRTFAKQKAMVVMNREVRGVASVVIDQREGARTAAEHLASHGARSIAYLAGPERSWADGMRWTGVRDAAAVLGIEARRLGPFLPTMTGGQRAAEAWLGSRTDGVIAYNDLMALSFMQTVQIRGLEVPDDVGIVGFDDLLASRLTRPQLSTVIGPLERMGATAAAHVMAIANGAHATTDRPVVMPARLIARGSSEPRP